MILKINESSKNATLTAATNTVKYPVSNLIDSRLTRLYRTDLSTSAEIVIDLGSALDVSGFVIANHNISQSVTSFKLQANSSDSWGSPAFEKDLTWSVSNINEDFQLQNYRFWRLVVEDGTNPDGYLQMGRIWLGPGYNPLGIGFNIDHERKTASVKTITPSGQSYLDKRYFYWVIKIKIPKITDVQHFQLVELFEIVDIGIPFFVTFDKAGKILKTQYVTYNFEGLKLTPLGRRDFFSTSMDFIEEVK
jgi:hypothetical protein